MLPDNKILKAIALDDEQPALSVLQNFSDRCPYVQLVKTFTSANAAKLYLEADAEVDFIFLDINMPSISGLEFAKRIPSHTKVVFTTSYSEYALESYEVDAVDYILKPLSYKRYLIAVEKVQRAVFADLTAHNASITLKVDYQNVNIVTAEILYVEAMDNYIKVHTPKKVFVTRMTLKEILSQLPKDLFLKVHRSYIISLSKVESFTSSHVIIRSTTIPVSQSNLKKLKSFL